MILNLYLILTVVLIIHSKIINNSLEKLIIINIAFRKMAKDKKLIKGNYYFKLTQKINNPLFKIIIFKVIKKEKKLQKLKNQKEKLLII